MKNKLNLLLSLSILILIVSAFSVPLKNLAQNKQIKKGKIVDQQSKRNLSQKKSHMQMDIFGVKEIYPGVPHGEEWFMDMKNATSDPRFYPGRPITLNTDGSWKMKHIQVRMGVYTSTGWSTAKIDTYDQAILSARGYMQASNDWKNVEMTAYVKLISYTSSTVNGPAHFEFEVR